MQPGSNFSICSVIFLGGRNLHLERGSSVASASPRNSPALMGFHLGFPISCVSKEVQTRCNKRGIFAHSHTPIFSTQRPASPPGHWAEVPCPPRPNTPSHAGRTCAGANGASEGHGVIIHIHEGLVPERHAIGGIHLGRSSGLTGEPGSITQSRGLTRSRTSCTTSPLDPGRVA